METMPRNSGHSALSSDERAFAEAVVTLVEHALAERLHPLRQEIAALREQLQQGAPAGRPAPGEPAPAFEIKPAYTYQEAAAIWDVSYRTVQGWVAAGKVSTIHKGGPRIPYDDVLRVWRKGVRRRRARRRKTVR